jgi:hypothetical protein
MLKSLDKLFKTRREKNIFYATCSVVVLALLFNVLIYPLVDEWSSTSSKLASKRNELKKVNQLLQNESKIIADYDQYQKVIRLKDPQKRPEDTLLLQTDELQKETGVQFSRMDPVRKRKVSKSDYQVYTIQVVFDGDLATIGRFLHGMVERGLYIEYLQIVPKNKAAHNPLLQTTLRIGKVISKEEEAGGPQ